MNTPTGSAAIAQIHFDSPGEKVYRGDQEVGEPKSPGKTEKNGKTMDGEREARRALLIRVKHPELYQGSDDENLHRCVDHPVMKEMRASAPWHL
jgi:hypothetical protein